MLRTPLLLAAKQTKKGKGPETIIVKLVSTVNPKNTLIWKRLRTDPKVIIKKFDRTAEQLVYFVETEKVASVSLDKEKGTVMLGRIGYNSVGRAHY